MIQSVFRAMREAYHQRYEAQQSSHDGPDASEPNHASHFELQNDGRAKSPTSSSPDPLGGTPIPRKYYPSHPNVNFQVSQCSSMYRQPAMDILQTSFIDTQSSHINDSVQIQHKVRNYGMELCLPNPAADSNIMALARAQKTVDSLKDELSDVIKSNTKEMQKMKNCIQSLQMEILEMEETIKKQDVRINKLRRTIRENKAAFDEQLQHEEACHRATTQIAYELEKNLEDCKERIFRSQPYQGLTDSELLKMYKNLSDSIEQWVHRSVSDDEKGILRLCDVPTWSEGPIALWEAFRMNEVDEIRRNPAIGIVMMSSLIMRFIWSGILCDDFSRLGLDQSTNVVLGGIVAALPKLEPAKDFEDSQSWKVDLQRALKVFCDARGDSSKVMKVQRGRILRSLEVVGTSDEPTQSIDDECYALLQESYKFAEGIRLSTSSYGFRMPSETDHSIMLAKHLTNYNVVDSRTGATLRPQSKPIEDRDGRVGEVVCDVFPAFFRRKDASCDEVELCKGTLVVHFDHPVPPVGRKHNSG